MKLTPFLDPLPVPQVLQPTKRYKCHTYYEVTMKEFFHKMHSQLPPTKIWGYNGQYPGPTIEAERGENVQVKWMNDLPSKHLLPVDHTLHGSHENMPEVRTVVHLHGVEVKPDSDGYPDAWFTRGYAETGPCFEREIYCYPNHQRAAALWYHDHAIGITRLNVYAGLAGMYIIRDEEERNLGLPSGQYEVPLVIQDKSFNCDGSLFYPAQPDNPPPNAPYPSVTPGFSGDVILVNGKAWPYFQVEPRKYRFRVLNGSNQRFYTMKLDGDLPFIQIGSDGGLLQKPVELSWITIGPAERVDLIIDFSKVAEGTKINLTNHAPTPFDFGEPPDPETTGLIMQFRVVAPTGTDTNLVPCCLSHINRFKECEATRIRDISLNVSQDRYQRLLFTLNSKGFMSRITEDPYLGDVEIWRIINGGLAYHPVHLHLIQFQILDRIPFDVDTYNATGKLLFTGKAVPPAPNELGWKDTVLAPPGMVTRIIMRFAPYTGRYVYHCHILEHEDYDMMRPFIVREKPDKWCHHHKCCHESCHSWD